MQATLFDRSETLTPAELLALTPGPLVVMPPDLDIRHIAHWFKEAVPYPTDKNRSTQIGVHTEECAEMWDAIGVSEVASALQNLATLYKTHAVPTDHANRIELLDSLCDQIVTAIGVAHMFGMDIQGALSEVNRSNFSKFKDGKPIFDANGKIAKNPLTYSKPDLKAFV